MLRSNSTLIKFKYDDDDEFNSGLEVLGEYSNDDDDGEEGEGQGDVGKDIKFKNFNKSELLSSLIKLSNKIGHNKS